MENLQPFVGQITFGGLAGFATGYALKKIGKVLAVILGIGFLSLQLLAYAGYIQIDWTRIQQDVDPLLDQERLRGFWNQLLEVLTFNLPFAGGFTAGLVLGLKRG
ncbi:FUN14 domain-containing protein [Marinithermus hydrothermalis]|uniref:FUN14 family protein n=1 Tax=Marinithermus hydrothermalis (strain DSM 14884 / JCM 11576 / T1) TaxID=869210 RepID=F2NQ77_MARHT|nr:FUN14 domain-containing protein [Marinithermus hydrothermalis]AEB11388.1 FUN14 family protein [Marinithermus hydrothermalis DSM 14884]